MDSLFGKVALVTGASRGIGKAIALALAKAGCDITVNFRAKEREAQDVCTEIQTLGRRAVAIGADVSKSKDVHRMIDIVEKELGTISILVNNAGIAKTQSIAEITEKEWDETMDINLKSAFLVTQRVLPKMRAQKWGRIINLSSAAAQMGGVVGPHYSASKAGVIGLTHSYAILLAKEGITVNTIAPGPVTTDMATGNPQLRPDMIPIGRFGTVDEIADTAVLLASNGFITGQTFNVNGGRYMS